MNFLIHAAGSPADFDEWNIPGWDASSMKSVMDDLTCWRTNPKPNRSIPSFLLNGEGETCAPHPTGI